MDALKRVGVIGLGQMGKRTARDLHAGAGGLIEIAAVVEPSDLNYRAGCEHLGCAPQRYPDAAAMLARHNLDGIVIATPNHCHLQSLQSLSGQRIPVLLEKPLEATFDKICAVVRFAQCYAGPILVHHCMRYSPISQKARALLTARAIGRVCSVNFTQHCPYGDSMYRTFRRTLAGGGGMFIEKATHDFDIMLSWLQTRPRRVSAVARRQVFGGDKPPALRCAHCAERLACKESVSNEAVRRGARPPAAGEDDRCVFGRDVDVPDNAACLIEFENGTFGTYVECYFSPRSYTSREYELTGTEGVMRVSYTAPDNHGTGLVAVYPRFGASQDVGQWRFDYRDRIHYNAAPEVVRHFYDVICGAAPPATTVEQAFAAELLGQAATQAAQSTGLVEVASLVPDDLKATWHEAWP